MTEIAEGITLKNFVGQRAIIQGASGAGKSYSIRQILESTHGDLQHIVLDVEDEFFTLREEFDYVLLGGDNGDVPLSSNSPELLARQLLELGVNAILQLNDMPLHEQRAFIGSFVQGLIDAPRELWHPALIVLDETHRYVPQNGDVDSSDALKALATQGRKRGFGAIFATQRLAQIHKDVSGSCPNRIIGRVDQALDRRVAADALGFSPTGKDAQELMALEAGTFWFAGPSLSPMPVLRRFHETKTTHITPGTGVIPTPPTSERMTAMLSALAKATAETAPNDAKGKAVADPDEIATLKATIRDLEKQVADASERAGQARLSALQQVSRFVSELSGDPLAGVTEITIPELSEEERNAIRSPKKVTITGAEKSAPSKPRTGAVTGHPLENGARSIWPVKLSWAQLATMCGRKARGGSFNTYRKRAIEDGIFREEGGKAVLCNPPDTGGIDPLDLLEANLPAPANEIFAHIRRSPGQSASDIGAELGRAPRGGSWNTAMSILRSNRLIEESAGIRVSPDLGAGT